MYNYKINDLSDVLLTTKRYRIKFAILGIIIYKELLYNFASCLIHILYSSIFLLRESDHAACPSDPVLDRVFD